MKKQGPNELYLLFRSVHDVTYVQDC